MNKFYLSFLYFLGLILILQCGISQAREPVWTFTPLTATTVSVSASGTTTVQYRVTNQSYKTHTLIMTPIQGISQSTETGNCPNPFTLGYQQSCTLSLTITGSAIKANTHGGPIVCQRGNLLQCYQPSAANSLNITRTSIDVVTAHYAYFTNNLNNTVTQCLIDNSTGLLSNCSATDPFAGVFNQPFGIALNNGFAYVANGGDNTVTYCAMDPLTGALIVSTCAVAASGLPIPSSVAFNNGFAYVANVNGGQASLCTVNFDNTLNCNGTGNTLGGSQGGIAFSGIYAYFPNTSQRVIRCGVDASDGTLNPCETIPGPSTFFTSIGIAITGNRAYVANAFIDMTVCTLDDALGFTGCSAANSGTTQQNGVGIFNNYVYIELSNSSSVLRCGMDITGLLTDCTDTGSTFSEPSGQIAFL